MVKVGPKAVSASEGAEKPWLCVNYFLFSSHALCEGSHQLNTFPSVPALHLSHSPSGTELQSHKSQWKRIDGIWTENTWPYQTGNRTGFSAFSGLICIKWITKISGASTANNIWIKLALIAAKNTSLRQWQNQTNPSVAEWTIFLSISTAEWEILSHTGEELFLGSMGPLGKG